MSLRDDLHASLSAELRALGDAGKGVWGELRPPAKPITPRQRVNDFLAMDMPQRQQLALELGPEGYTQLVTDRINDAVNIIGPAAHKLYPFFTQGIPAAPVEPDPIMELGALLDDVMYGEQ